MSRSPDVLLVANLYESIARLSNACAGGLFSCNLAHPRYIHYKDMQIPLQSNANAAMYYELFKKMTLVQLVEITAALIPHTHHHIHLHPVSLIDSIATAINYLNTKIYGLGDDARNHADLACRCAELTRERDSLRETLAMVSVLVDPRVAHL